MSDVVVANKTGVVLNKICRQYVIPPTSSPTSSSIFPIERRVECGLTPLLLASNIGVWGLALRGAILIQQQQQQQKKKNGKPASHPELDLVAHFGLGSLNAPEQMKEALVVVFLLRLMGKEGEPDLETANLLRKLMRVAQFNSHEVVGSAEAPEVIGSAVNPHLALINHSCDANYGRVWTTASDGRNSSRYTT